MSVFVLHAYGNHGAVGMAVVAAQNFEHAKELLVGIDSIWNVDYKKAQKITKLPVEYSGEARIFSHIEQGS